MIDPIDVTARRCRHLGWCYLDATGVDWPDMQPPKRPRVRRPAAELRLWHEMLRQAWIAHAREIIAYMADRFGEDGVPAWATALLSDVRAGRLPLPNGGGTHATPAEVERQGRVA